MIEFLEYIEGDLVNRVTRSSRAVKGEKVGTIREDGYLHFTLKRKYYFAHRAIWEMFNGPIPEGMQIDHINRVRDDNRIENLRLVTSQENKWNTEAPGIYASPTEGKWCAQICKDGHRKHLGTFESKEEAENEYRSAKRRLHIIGEHNG